MAKWADYLVSAVRYGTDPKHITHLKVHEDKDEKVGVGKEYPRNDVVDAINKGKSFVTIFMKSEKWQKGQKVFVIKVGGKSYLKTIDK